MNSTLSRFSISLFLSLFVFSSLNSSMAFHAIKDLYIGYKVGSMYKFSMNQKLFFKKMYSNKDVNMLDALDGYRRYTKANIVMKKGLPFLKLESSNMIGIVMLYERNDSLFVGHVACVSHKADFKADCRPIRCNVCSNCSDSTKKISY